MRKKPLGRMREERAQYVRGTYQWATSNGVNAMLRGKVVGVAETCVEAIARYSMKPPPLAASGKNREEKEKKTEAVLKTERKRRCLQTCRKVKQRRLSLRSRLRLNQIGMRVFVNLNDFTVWRAELITPEGVELWRFSSGDGEVEVAHREHAAGHVSVYKTTEEKCVSDSDDDDESFEAPYYGTLSDNQTSISKTTSIDVVRCEGGHFLAETSRGYFFVDFSSHVSGIDKSAAALSTNEDLKICGYTSSLGVGGAPYGATFGSVILMHLVVRRNVAFWEQSLDAAARLQGR